ncbi:hypothetical protein CSC2_48040 [Clostridium zeae]|uniref:Uncharacterized protein n=1 Tax=Clostridium zeae TaxID=2759022 RepID=A0ABQ1EIA4_9CLOT|nr:hypothetical protein [Clostridium zeae]GFZ34278.1 hypothetical protein CSC2_48040 [Clostridium zeae]
MNSFAIWYDSEKNDAINATINFNLWKLDDAYRITKGRRIRKNTLVKKKMKKVESCTYYLDIGMKISNISSINKINIYTPFKITKDNIVDLGETMVKNKKVIDAIFNENSKVINQGFENNIEVEIIKDKNNNISEKIKIFSLDFEWQKNISVEQIENGGVITIDVSNLEVDEGVYSYIRFRIHGKELGKLIIEKNFSDNIFKTYSEKNEIIDFRLNEKRAMSDGLTSLIASKREFYIKAIHFLLLMDMKYTLAATGLDYSARALEPDLWNEYIGCEIQDTQFVGYHWKKKCAGHEDCSKCDKHEHVDNFNSLIRIEIREINAMTLLAYIVVLIFFSVLSNFLYDLTPFSK